MSGSNNIVMGELTFKMILGFLRDYWEIIKSKPYFYRPDNWRELEEFLKRFEGIYNEEGSAHHQ
jgi:hypothetical protein